MTEPRTLGRGRSVGAQLLFWRRSRRLSQLALAAEANVSARHLCFVETGRAKPSRDMVLLLANVLDVPLRERNSLLLAAGFAPHYAESPLDAPALDAVRAALDAILEHQEPYPAVVMNRRWDIVRTNAAASRLFGFLLGASAASAPTNVLRLFFHPDFVKPHVANWDAVALALLRRVQREALAGTPDAATLDVLTEVLAYPGIPSSLRAALDSPGDGPGRPPILPVSFAGQGLRFNYFSTITTLGTPQDVTLQELRIESFFPTDDLTRQHAHELASQRR